MIVTGEFAQERRELQKVLASGIFDRAPSLAQVLTYVCEKYFDGTAHDLKEYNIAVDALGRTVDFDQKKDSIVRVQMHRLRDRLAEYYSRDGADHSIMLEIPQGQYVPRFVARPSLAPAPLEAPLMEPPRQPVATIPDAEIVPPSGTPWMAAAAGLAAIAAVVGFLAFRQPSEPAPSPAAAAMGEATDSVRMMMGLEKETFTDGFGEVWEADRDFEGGTIFKVHDRPIRGTRDPKLYQSRRQGNFTYHIPLKPGPHELRLHFAEVNFGETGLAGLGGEGSRNFGIVVNGKTVLEKIDVIGESGASMAHVRTFKDVYPASDGKVHLTFTPLVNVPFLNAIEITPGTAGKLRPVRIVMQDRPYTDPKGNVWQPDRYAEGGHMVKRVPLEGAPDPELFSGERFGKLSYLIPVPPGHYTLNLYMAERWNGPGMPGGGDGPGDRIFDILVNGVALVRDFDIFKKAGGADRPLVESFHGLEPNHQGNLAISMVPYKNFPLVNALEVVDESH